MILRWFRTFVIYLPFIIFMIINFRIVIGKKFNFFNLLILVLLFNFVGSITALSESGVLNAEQFYHNTLAFNNVLFISVFMFCFSKIICSPILKNKVLYFGSFVMIIGFIFYNAFQYTAKKLKFYNIDYSSDYINKVLDETKGTFVISTCIFSKEEYENGRWASDLWFAAPEPGYITQFSYGYRDVVNINSFLTYNNIKNADNNNKYWLENSIFYLFITNQKTEGVFRSYEQSQLDFIDKYHIKFLFASKNAEINKMLEKRVIKEITDNKSGEKFYILKNT